MIIRLYIYDIVCPPKAVAFLAIPIPFPVFPAPRDQSRLPTCWLLEIGFDLHARVETNLFLSKGVEPDESRAGGEDSIAVDGTSNGSGQKPTPPPKVLAGHALPITV